MLLHFLSNVTVFRCISLDNKKPAKLDSLRVFVLRWFS